MKRLIIILVCLSYASISSGQFVIRPNASVGYANWRLDPNITDNVSGEKIIYQNNGLTYSFGIDAIQQLDRYVLGLIVNYQQTYIKKLESNSSVGNLAFEISNGSVNSWNTGMLIGAKVSQDEQSNMGIELMYGLNFTKLNNTEKNSVGIFINLGFRFGTEKLNIIPYYQFNRLKSEYIFSSDVVNVHHNFGVKVGYLIPMIN